MIDFSQRGRTSVHRRSLTEDSQQLAETTDLILADLKDASPFFRTPSLSTPSRLALEEVVLGSKLGQGEFGSVWEVHEFHVADECTCPRCEGVQLEDLPQAIEARHNLELPPAIQIPLRATTDSDDDHISVENISDCCVDCNQPPRDSRRGFMAAHALRKGVARYAVKHVRRDLSGEALVDASLDLACEAEFLSHLSHSSIVRLKATVGTPGEPDFMIVMDRLLRTLQEQMDTVWKPRRTDCSRLFGKDKEGLEALMADQLLAALDVARAIRYLHKHKIVYRDIKPENAGVDVRGDVRLFDFGLAKELKPKDLVEAPDEYLATGLTGSRRYMVRRGGRGVCVLGV